MAEKVNQPKIKIALTPKQKEQIRQATGKEVAVLELKPEELEERVAPVMFNPKEYT